MNRSQIQDDRNSVIQVIFVNSKLVEGASEVMRECVLLT